MSKLIEALQIFLKYGDPDYPTHCEHDTLWICGIDPDHLSEEDAKRVEELGFFIDDGGYKSHRFGSA